MRKTFLISIVSSFLTLCMGVSAQGVLLNVTTLDRYPYGIDGGNIVGEYEDGSGRHGFRAVVPEPAMLSLLAIGMLMASHRRRLRRV